MVLPVACFGEVGMGLYLHLPKYHYTFSNCVKGFGADSALQAVWTYRIPLQSDRGMCFYFVQPNPENYIKTSSFSKFSTRKWSHLWKNVQLNEQFSLWQSHWMQPSPGEQHMYFMINLYDWKLYFCYCHKKETPLGMHIALKRLILHCLQPWGLF